MKKTIFILSAAFGLSSFNNVFAQEKKPNGFEKPTQEVINETKPQNPVNPNPNNTTTQPKGDVKNPANPYYIKPINETNETINSPKSPELDPKNVEEVKGAKSGKSDKKDSKKEHKNNKGKVHSELKGDNKYNTNGNKKGKDKK